jgi:ferredoxin
MGQTPTLPKVDRSRCQKCGRCVTACACHSIEMGEDGPVFHCPDPGQLGRACTDAEDCFCLCMEVCPNGAIECPFQIVLEDEESATAG